MNTQDIQSQDDWIRYGVLKGWCTPPVCATHDGIPQTREEDESWENGEDPCVHVIRPYYDDEERRQVEENHAPTNWRNHYGAQP